LNFELNYARKGGNKNRGILRKNSRNGRNRRKGKKNATCLGMDGVKRKSRMEGVPRAIVPRLPTRAFLKFFDDRWGRPGAGKRLLVGSQPLAWVGPPPGGGVGGALGKARSKVGDTLFGSQRPDTYGGCTTFPRDHRRRAVTRRRYSPEACW